MNRNQEVIETRGDYRVVIEPDQYPDAPYVQGPLFRLDNLGSGIWPELLGDEFTGSENIIEALTRWGPPSGYAWDKTEKYLRTFHGVRHIRTYYSGEYWYVAIDPEAWRRENLEPGYAGDATEGILSEYRAWIEGDVYVITVQKRVTWTTDDDGFGDRDEWEDVDSVGGYYGCSYAVEAASEALARYGNPGDA